MSAMPSTVVLVNDPYSFNGPIPILKPVTPPAIIPGPASNTQGPAPNLCPITGCPVPARFNPYRAKLLASRAFQQPASGDAPAASEASQSDAKFASIQPPTVPEAPGSLFEHDSVDTLVQDVTPEEKVKDSLDDAKWTFPVTLARAASFRESSTSFYSDDDDEGSIGASDDDSEREEVVGGRSRRGSGAKNASIFFRPFSM